MDSTYSKIEEKKRRSEEIDREVKNSLDNILNTKLYYPQKDDK